MPVGSQGYNAQYALRNMNSQSKDVLFAIAPQVIASFFQLMEISMLFYKPLCG